MGHTALTLLLFLCSSVSAEVRLVDGAGRCAGRLEREIQGNWTPEESDGNHDWNLTSAAAVCRQLDCGSVVSLRSIPTSSDRPDPLPIFFTQAIFHPFYPSFWVEIICSDSVRLVNGSSLCSGRLEVKSNQLWSSVPEDAFDQQDAEVVCRELDCGAPSALHGALYGEAEAPLWSKKFNCDGHELTLQDCDSSVRRYSGKAVGLTCSEPKDVRLVGGVSRCAGTLEIKKQGEWRPAYMDYWNLRFSGELCHLLNCGSPVLTRRTTTSHRHIWGSKPYCDELNLTKCFTKLTNSFDATEITCSDLFRLVNGSNRCSGRLEVMSNRLWSSVCETDFDQQDAEVVCRELGCGAPAVLQGALYGEPKAPMWRTEFSCEGHESVLQDCDSSGLTRNICPKGKAVGLTCSDPDIVRLVGGTSRCTGQLQVKHSESWRTAISIEREWSLKATHVVCQWLDCGLPVTTIIRQQQEEEPVWWISSSCIEMKSVMMECVTMKDGVSSSSMEITCSESMDSVRLVDGAGRCSGRLEVRSDQSWSSVCVNNFDQQDAEVVCKELGCGALSVLQGAPYAEDKSPVWSREFYCGGDESALLDCDSTSSAVKNCSTGEVVHLTCSEFIRLVGRSGCSGILELFNQGEWRPVVDWEYFWNHSSAAAVCAQLGCGFAVFTRMRDDFTDRPVWWIGSSCVQSASALQDCLILTEILEDYNSLEVTCSDFLVKPNISMSTYIDGVSGAKKQGSQVLLGTDFSIICCIEPQYQGGSFQLIFSVLNITRHYTLPAVNHSALFLFSAANSAHQGNYSCIYHIYVFSQNFSSMSPPLILTVSASLTDLIIRFVVLLLGMIIVTSLLYCYYKTNHLKLGQQRNHGVFHGSGTA